MRETLLDLMIRFNNENMLDPWNENEEELDDLDDLLGSYRRGTLGSYQAGTALITSGANAGQRRSTNAMGQPIYMGGNTFGSAGAEAMGQSEGFGPNAQGPVTAAAPAAGAPAAGAGSRPTTLGSPEAVAGQLAGYGSDLLQPGSDLSKRWMEQMRGQIGDQSDAAQRAAGYQAAQSGFGSGASPELLQMQTDIGVAGQEAAGQSAADFMLRAPELGVGAMGGALGNQVGMRGQDLSSRMASESNRLSREGMQMGDARAQAEADALREYQDQMLSMQRQDQERQAKMDELAALYSGYGTTGGGGGGGGGAYSPPATPRWGRNLGVR